MEQETMKRDTTRALEIVRQLREQTSSEAFAASFDELTQILTDMDARTGRRDPSKRRPSKKAAKKKKAVRK